MKRPTPQQFQIALNLVTTSIALAHTLHTEILFVRDKLRTRRQRSHAPLGFSNSSKRLKRVK